MLGLVFAFVETICLGLPVLWGALLFASISGPYNLVGENGFRFFGWTVVAAGAIVFLSAGRRGWRWAALAVVGIGTLRLLLAANVYGVCGVFICCTGLLLLIFERKRQMKLAAHEQLRPAQTSVQQSSDSPQAVQSEYGYEHLIQRVRYNFSDIVGMTDIKKRLILAAREIISSSDQKTHLQSRDDPRNGILLFGDPGNGKTMFAEALSGELRIPFIKVAYGDVASRWVNETPARIKAVFDTARRMSPCLLFIDEFDSLVKSRGSERTHSMDHDMANVMLTEIVALRGAPVVLVAATNFIDSVLDQASIRDGRFDYRIEVPSPDLEARKALLHNSLCRALGQDCIDPDTLANLAQRWEGFSASRLDALGRQLGEMRDNGLLSSGNVTSEAAMAAMRILQGRKGKLPENVKSTDEIIMPELSRDILRNLAFRMKNAVDLEKIGGRIPTGLLFAGPPGTGKTAAAMSLAKESGYAFLSTTGGQIIARPEIWESLVREARELRPTVVLIDEGEDILRTRRYSNVASLTNRILATIDGAAGRTRDIIYICTTNHLDQIDPAALRGGRFEETIMFDVPSSQDMIQYACAHLKKLAGSTYVIMPGTRLRLQQLLAGRSIADADAVLQKIVDMAAVRALRERVNEIRATDVELAAASVFAAQDFVH
ncbi:AAA family ATPase [Paraburkholderia diazotrophica]|uniref:AAA family ATPase n=1 Tax=Paraburkholderia diazotrophica TaxID=667676 RepID=UPI003173618D